MKKSNAKEYYNAAKGFAKFPELSEKHYGKNFRTWFRDILKAGLKYYDKERSSTQDLYEMLTKREFMDQAYERQGSIDLFIIDFDSSDGSEGSLDEKEYMMESDTDRSK